MEFCEVAIKKMNTLVVKVSGEMGLMVVLPRSPAGNGKELPGEWLPPSLQMGDPAER